MIGGLASVPPPPPPPPVIANELEFTLQCKALPSILACLNGLTVAEKWDSPPETLDTLPLKMAITRPTFGDQCIRTLTIPPRGDLRFDLMRFCPHSSKEGCKAARGAICELIHYKKLIQPHTDISLGDCSYLDTCRHLFSCKFVHYIIDLDGMDKTAIANAGSFQHRLVRLNQFDVLERDVSETENQTSSSFEKDGLETWFENGVIRNLDREPVPPQWIRCDMRSLHLGIFNGLVSVVMADPPWDIRMDLPYGTLTDHEMKNLRVDLIQEEGLLFLWVTGRAMEIARDCMTTWGYNRVDEIVWVKTNHLNRIIRTGRTGHWLNHSKEHCLVGIKGNPKINIKLECDVIVSEVRETSRKPDEIYRMIERICPYGLKLELFGRSHNLRQNWITLGNQLDGVSLHSPKLIQTFKEHPGGLRQVCFEEEQRQRLNSSSNSNANNPNSHSRPSPSWSNFSTQDMPMMYD